MKELKWRLLYWTFKQSYRIDDYVNGILKNENYAFGLFADKVVKYLVKDIANYTFGRDFKYLGEFPLVNNYGWDMANWCIEDELWSAIYSAKDYNTMMFNLGAIKFELDMINLYYDKEFEYLTQKVG